LRITIEIGEPDGRPDGDSGTASANPAVVINIDATAAAELQSSSSPAAAVKPLSAGSAPLLNESEGPRD